MELKAQDYHLSQFDMAPMYMNPALTGMYLGERNKFRMNGNYRSQWQKLQGKPYSTVAYGFDMPYQRYGFGIYLMDNLAGNGNFGTFNFLLSGAYQITSDESDKHYLTTGLQMGFFQKRLNPGNLLFESQYTTSSGLDGTMPTLETFSREKLFKFDANLGVFYKYKDANLKVQPFGGFSIYHLTMPNESFISIKSRTPMRFNVVAGCDAKVHDQVKLTPQILFMYQGKAMELNLGLLAYYQIKDSDYEVMGGLALRTKDAAIIHLGLKQGNNVFRFSYDIITSYLRNFGGRRSGFEMGIIYTGLGKSYVSSK
jgi:type IX secretion system PorP/SprF family membrane protein